MDNFAVPCSCTNSFSTACEAASASTPQPPPPLILGGGCLSPTANYSTSFPSSLGSHLSPKSHADFKRTGSHRSLAAPSCHVVDPPECHCSCDDAVLSSSPESTGRAGGAADVRSRAQLEGGPVRVVQIFNPVLVKTDVANFRSLVQRLTGKSGCSLKYWNKLRRLHAAMPVILEAAAVLADQDPTSAHIDHIQGIAYNAAQPEQTNSEDEALLLAAGLGSRSSTHSCSAFSELDIHAALVSDGPLPDLTILPPLLITSTFPTHSLFCT